MPTDESVLLSALLTYTRKPLSNSDWQTALLVHRGISKSSFEQLIALLYLLFPLDGTCLDQSKILYRRLFFVSHILQILSEFEPLSQVASRFMHLRNKFARKTVAVELLIDESKNYDKMAVEQSSMITTLFQHIMEIFILSGMQQLTTNFTLEWAILTNLIEPPKLALFSPLLSAVLHYQLADCKIK